MRIDLSRDRLCNCCRVPANIKRIELLIELPILGDFDNLCWRTRDTFATQDAGDCDTSGDVRSTCNTHSRFGLSVLARDSLVALRKQKARDKSRADHGTNLVKVSCHLVGAAVTPRPRCRSQSCKERRSVLPLRQWLEHSAEKSSSSNLVKFCSFHANRIQPAGGAPSSCATVIANSNRVTIQVSLGSSPHDNWKASASSSYLFATHHFVTHQSIPRIRHPNS